MYWTGVLRVREVLMKAASVAHTSPRASGVQKPGASSPRTPRHKGSVASAGVAIAASLRMALQMAPTVAANVSCGWRASS